jgi:hypothetical protein
MSEWIASWFNFNNSSRGLSAEASAEYDTRSGSDASVDIVLAGADIGLSIFEVKREINDDSELSITVLSGGLDLSLKRDGVGAMVEASAVKAEVTYGPLYLSGSLNCNTGIKLGSKGCQAGFFGFGFTLGVNGKWTFDSPVGSVGVSAGSILLRNEPMRCRHEPMLLRN